MATKHYTNQLTAILNRKGVLDVDPVKGCKHGMQAHPGGGCYGLCYAASLAKAYGWDFASSVSRHPSSSTEEAIEWAVRAHKPGWFRMGTMGDPSHDWPLVAFLADWLGRFATPVIVTKHWVECPSVILKKLIQCGAVFNTSVSPLDSDAEREYRLGQHLRIGGCGGKAFLRVVTANFGDTDRGRYLRTVQKWLLMHANIIDTPLRIPGGHPWVACGDVRCEKRDGFGCQSVSMWDGNVYVGHCNGCPDQCGAKL